MLSRLVIIFPTLSHDLRYYCVSSLWFSTPNLKQSYHITHLLPMSPFYQGTHDELLALDGKYAEMWNMQLHNARGSKLSSVDLKAVATESESSSKKDSK